MLTFGKYLSVKREHPYFLNETLSYKHKQSKCNHNILHYFYRAGRQAAKSPRISWALWGMITGKPFVVLFLLHLVLGNSERSVPWLYIPLLNMLTIFCLQQGQRGSKITKNFLSTVRDDHWKILRSTVSPTFSTGKLRQVMCTSLLANEIAVTWCV